MIGTEKFEKTILRAYICSLMSSGIKKSEAEHLAKNNLGLFKEAEAAKIQTTDGYNYPVPNDMLAKYVSEKYLTPLSSFIEDAKSKRTLQDLDVWWQKHQNRASMNLSEGDFNELAIHIIPSLRAGFVEEPTLPTEETSHAQEDAPQICTDLVIDINPDKLSVNDNFLQFAEHWRLEMQKADFVPQAEDDLKDIRGNIKKCQVVEAQIDDALQRLSEYLELALKGDPEVKKYTDYLLDRRNKMQLLREETRSHRLNIANIPKKWLNNQKAAAVTEHLELVNTRAEQLFYGKIISGRNDADARARLIAAYKNKRTVGSIVAAVESEADLIISEMESRAELCRQNLERIEGSGRPALFQDWKSLMIWEPELLEQQIRLRIQTEDLEKARAKRCPEKLAEWKAIVDGITNIPNLESWFPAHKDEINQTMPHEDDRDELIQHCGARKQHLKVEFAKKMAPPPPDEEVEGTATKAPDQRKSTKNDQHEQAASGQDETECTAVFEVTIAGKGAANALFSDIWEMVNQRGGVASKIDDYIEYEKIKKKILAKASEELPDPEHFEPCNVGNLDDAYERGLDHGEIYFAQELFDILNK